MNSNLNKCHCGSNSSYNKCCGAIHQNIFLAKTAEQLMRSRYSAFVNADDKYLQLSHHSKTRPNKKEQKELIRWAKSVEWFKLVILNTENGLENELKGTVEFKAFFYTNGILDYIHEKSSFIKDNNHWVYLGIIS